MKKILIATTNPAKIQTAKVILEKIGYEGLTFADLKINPKEPDETLSTAEEIANEKALGYAQQFRDFPVLARDDTNLLIGVAEEDDPKNHNKAFVEKRAGKYSDENGTRVFAQIAHKYGGEIPLEFRWGYALAWWENGEIKSVSGLAINNNMKLVDKPSPKIVPGFSFSPVTKVLLKSNWKYDSELTEEESWEAYWTSQMETILSLIKKCPLL